MLRLLAILAATAPSFLSAFMLVECGYFAYEVTQPAPSAVAVWSTARYASELLPIVLAFLALWAPLWFRVGGAIAAAVTLAANALTFAVPYTSPCGTPPALWLPVVCAAAVLAASLLSRPEPPPPRRQAALWSAVVLLALAQTLARNTPTSDVGCYADMKGTWALAFYHLDTAHGLYYWVSVAAIGAVLSRHRAAWLCGLVLLVPALFEPAAWLLSDAPHNCSSTLALFNWPYLLAGVLALLTATRLARQPQ
ncbi:hypothetical protein ACWDA3_41970 [Nonomuraea rubra]